MRAPRKTGSSDICHMHYWSAGQDCDLTDIAGFCVRRCPPNCAEPTQSTDEPLLNSNGSVCSSSWIHVIQNPSGSH